MTLEEKIDYLKRKVKFHLTMEDSCVDSLKLYPDLQVAENGVTHKEIAEMLQEELEWLEELKSMRTLIMPGGTIEKTIRIKTVDEFVEKLCEYFPDNSERVHFDGHTCDILTLDNALDTVNIVAESMKEINKDLAR